METNNKDNSNFYKFLLYPLLFILFLILAVYVFFVVIPFIMRFCMNCFGNDIDSFFIYYPAYTALSFSIIYGMFNLCKFIFRISDKFFSKHALWIKKKKK